MKSLAASLIIAGESPSVECVAREALSLIGIELVETRVTDPPISCLDPFRNQLRAECVAELVRSLASSELIAVGIVGLDAYVPGLNFVFGLALPSLRVATVYTPRLRLGASRELFEERLIKEVMHEVGHVLGLSHCPNRLCVMSFSNSLAEVDIKKPAFCARCARKLALAGVKPRAVLG